MKKVMAIVVMMVIMMTTIATAEGNIDYVWFDSMKEDFEKAMEHGERIDDSSLYLYDGIIYDFYYTSISLEYFGLEGPWNRSRIEELEEVMEELYKDVGMIYPDVEIIFAGCNGDGGDLYEFTIMAMNENLNDIGREDCNGFIKEGICYNGMKTIGQIYD